MNAQETQPPAFKEQIWVGLAGGVGAMFGTAIWEGIWGEHGLRHATPDERYIIVLIILVISFLVWRYIEPLLAWISYGHQGAANAVARMAPFQQSWKRGLLALAAVIFIHFDFELFSHSLQSGGLAGIADWMVGAGLLSIVTYAWARGAWSGSATKYGSGAGLGAGALWMLWLFSARSRHGEAVIMPALLALPMVIGGVVGGNLIDQPGFTMRMSPGLRVACVGAILSLLPMVPLMFQTPFDSRTLWAVFVFTFWGLGIDAYLPSRSVLRRDPSLPAPWPLKAR